MTKLRILASGAFFIAVAAAPGMASALTTFSAYDDGASTAAAAVNSNAAQALFSAAAGPTDLITFEDVPLGPTDGLTVAPGVTLGPDLPSGQEIVNAAPGSCGGAVVCGFNITSGGGQFAFVNGGTLTFNFASPITSFGAYLTGVQLADFIEVGGTNVVSVPNPNASDGGVAFLGFTGSAPVTQVVIDAQPGIGDPLGVDNVQYTAWVEAVPEPATWTFMIVGVGALGAMLRRRSMGIRPLGAA